MRKNYFRFSAILAVMALIAALFLMGASSAPARPFTTDFTGTSTCVEVPGTGEFKVTGGKLHIKGSEYVCEDVADDLRVSGTNKVVVSGILDLNDNLSGPLWGSSRIENVGGSWMGFWTGKRTSDGFVYFRQSSHGLDGYKNMQAWWDVERLSPDPADPYSFSGYILAPGQ